MIMSAVTVVLLMMTVLIVLTIFEQINREKETGEVANKLTREVLELNIIASEYFMHHEKRMQQQWWHKYKSINNKLEKIFDKKHTQINQNIIKYYKSMGNLFMMLESNFEKRMTLIKENKSRAMIDRIFSLEEMLTAQLLLKSQMVTIECNKLSMLIKQRVTRTEQMAGWTILVYTIVFVIVVCGISFFVVTSITIPIKKLSEGAAIIGKRNFDYKIELTTKNELNSLASAFNSMSLDLKVSHEELLSAKDNIIKMSQAIEQISSSVIITDEKGHIEYVNPQFSKTTGYSKEEVIGRNPRILKSGELSNEVYKQLWNTITSGYEWHGEFHNKKKNGDLYWELASISIIKSSGGGTINFIKVGEDITRRKLTEAELSKAREGLLHAEKLSAIGKLTASIAHEFNNPITGIRNTLESIIENGADKPLNARLLKLVQLSIGESNRMAGLVKDLQDFNRPSSGLFTANVDINELIDEVILMDKKHLNNRNIIIEKSYDVNIPQISVITDQIKQVVLNIIQNADDAISKTGGKITINTLHDEQNIIIQIKDTGAGIKKELMNSIFEPFFSTKPAVKGTGLGLSVSYGIIKKHGGDILVESEVGKGSTFTIKLVIKQKEPVS